MYIIFNIILLLLFAVYIEYFSRIGNIIFRINYTGFKIFQPLQLLNIIIAPLFQNFMWDIKNWDINYLIIFSVANIIYYIVKKIYKIYSLYIEK